MSFIKLLALLSVIITSGCASEPKYKSPTNSEEVELAQISLYRAKKFYRANEYPFFYIDGKLAGKMGPGDSIIAKVIAGRHIITVREPFLFIPGSESGRIDHDFKKDGKYYLRYSVDSDIPFLLGNTVVASGSSTFSLSDEKSFNEKK
ncbi:MAG: hypothetical protein JKY85_00115 [Porticoccus sp.]|nr:hypothetical protein [Porticoccus sp.]